MSFVRVHKHYIHIPFLALGVIEFGLLFCAWFASLLVQRIALPDYDISFAAHAPNALIFAGLLSCCTLAMGVYSSLNRQGYANMLLRTLVSFCLLGSLGLMALNFALPNLELKSQLYFWAILAAIAILCTVRCMFILTVDRKSLQRRAVIWGAGEVAKCLHEDYTKKSVPGAIYIVGHIAANGEEQAPTDLPLFAQPDDWLSFCKTNQIHQIIIAPDERRRQNNHQFPLEQLLHCKLNGVEVTEASTFYECHLTKIDLDLLKPSWMLFSDGFKVSKSRNVSKRLTDLVISCFLLLLCLPLITLTALLVLLETGRPVLYSQTRVGLNGKTFRIYKFRSMVKNAEKAGQAQWAQKNDARITKVGAFIRNTRLDELPQLYNVIKGDMSFVGPRPERPEFVTELEKNIPYYALRHEVKPGLMGWAQLNYPYGASEEDARNKLEYDLYYTKNHSFFMDVLIMIQTIEVVLLGKGVH